MVQIDSLQNIHWKTKGTHKASFDTRAKYLSTRLKKGETRSDSPRLFATVVVAKNTPDRSLVLTDTKTFWFT